MNIKYIILVLIISIFFIIVLNKFDNRIENYDNYNKKKKNINNDDDDIRNLSKLLKTTNLTDTVSSATTKSNHTTTETPETETPETETPETETPETETTENNDINKLNELNTKESEIDINEKVDSNNVLLIKKTDSYDLVYSSENLYVWDPKSIDNYFSIGQLVTNTNTPPTKASILVNSNNIPDSYVLITQIKNIGVWKPQSDSKDYNFVSYIFSEKKPSLNKIRGISNKYLEESQIISIITSVKTVNNEEYDIWAINNSNYFILKDKENKQTIDKVYSINDDLISPEKLIPIKNTKKYEKIWSNFNKNNQKISIWKPITENDYKIVGYISLNDESDPNDDLETPTFHYSLTKPILQFNSEPIVYNEKDQTNIQFWKPISRDGYKTLGDVATTNNKEPVNDVISSIPLEYLNENKNIINIWNSSLGDNKCSIWSNNNFCNVFDYYTAPNKIVYTINNNYIKNELDKFDTSKEIILDFIPKNINIKLLTIKDAIKNTLSKKLDINPKRFSITKFDKKKYKIFATLKQKVYNSIEDNTDNVFKDLTELIYKKQINIKNNNLLILIINNISVINDKSNDTIKLNNKEYLNNI